MDARIPKCGRCLFHISEPCCILQIYSATMYCLMFIILVGHSRIAFFHLLSIGYHMQLLDLQGAMGTKKTIKAVKHQWRPLNTKRTMKTNRSTSAYPLMARIAAAGPVEGWEGQAGAERTRTQTCQGLPGPARACRGLLGPAKACQGRPGPARA